MSRAWFFIALIPALPCAAQTPRKEAVSSLVPARPSGATSSLIPATGPAAQPVRTGTSGITPAATLREGQSGLVRPPAETSLVKPSTPPEPKPPAPEQPPPALLPPSPPVVEMVRPAENPSAPLPVVTPPPEPVHPLEPAPVAKTTEQVPVPDAETPSAATKASGKDARTPVVAFKKAPPAMVAVPEGSPPAVPVLITREKPWSKPAAVVKRSEVPSPVSIEIAPAKKADREPAAVSAPVPKEHVPASIDPPPYTAIKVAASPGVDSSPTQIDRIPPVESLKPNAVKPQSSPKAEAAREPEALPMVLHEAPVIQPPISATMALQPSQPVATHVAEKAPQKSTAEAARTPLFKPLPVQSVADLLPPVPPATASMEVAKLESGPLSASPVIDVPKVEAPKLGSPKIDEPKLELPPINLPNLPEPVSPHPPGITPPKAKLQRPRPPTPHAAHDDLRLPPVPPKPAAELASAPNADPLPPAPAASSLSSATVESIAPPMPVLGSADTTQIAPSAPASRKPLPYAANFGNDPDSAELAAEVAAILSSSEPSPETPRIARVARPKVVSFPSEQWLREASAGIERLPENERPAAFQKVIERYKRMRSEEKSTPR